ncbi:glycoside hydrolase family 16 protein [Flavihumibacter sp. UBA7668]|uniref:glycoside hydrolase family 16 protein n=1 Tax=Flavihumibacter sp. UBA7668 TaxID=1946542 RepID=UPI0025BCE5D5|nr:glycoside hydrolase family 16 protein [Flavihumibacter sp. UBA7668]
MNFACIYKLIIFCVALFFVDSVFAKTVDANSISCELDLLGTRSWIRVEWGNCFENDIELKIYWSADGVQPAQPQAKVSSSKKRFYIEGVKPSANYFIWLESKRGSGQPEVLKGNIKTDLKWRLDTRETSSNDVLSSTAVPPGMKIFWQDEFNDALLNRNKWSTNYYSTIDYLYQVNLAELKSNTLAQPAYKLNGSTITLFTNDSLPAATYDRKNDKKISSIQTYDWVTGENLLDNSRGGYFEVRVKRSSTGKPRGLNTAFWFDSPGPDLRYYLEQGTAMHGVQGIRPAGQVFKIDVFEYLNAQFVLHGKVDAAGKFQHNLATHIAKGFQHVDQWVVHGMLWTPTSLKHYINGQLIKTYDDTAKNYAPNHFMNVLLGSYGGGGSVSMEVDYIRAYGWPLEVGNELPNGGGEYSEQLLPWEGTAGVARKNGRSGKNGFVLEPGQEMYQYIYLLHSTAYEFGYWAKGKGKLELEISTRKPVVGEVGDQFLETGVVNSIVFKQGGLRFKTGPDQGINTKIVQVKLANTGAEPVYLDDLTIKREN